MLASGEGGGAWRILTKKMREFPVGISDRKKNEGKAISGLWYWDSRNFFLKIRENRGSKNETAATARHRHYSREANRENSGLNNVRWAPTHENQSNTWKISENNPFLEKLFCSKILGRWNFCRNRDGQKKVSSCPKSVLNLCHKQSQQTAWKPWKQDSSFPLNRAKNKAQFSKKKPIIPQEKTEMKRRCSTSTQTHTHRETYVYLKTRKQEEEEGWEYLWGEFEERKEAVWWCWRWRRRRE